MLKIRIGVAVGLELGQVAFCLAITLLMKFHALFNLFGHRGMSILIRRIECTVITESASSPAHLSVSIRTGKTGVYAYLLNALPVFPPEIVAVCIESSVCSPGIAHASTFIV